MVASLVRLLHSGTQDQRLLPKVGPRDVSAYKRVLIRAGRMTTQLVRLDFQQKPQFGQQAFCQLQVKGELLTRLYLVTTLPDITAAQTAAKALAPSTFVGPTFTYTNSVGHALVQTAVVDIGGARVETLDSRLLEIHDEFDTPLEKVLNVNTMIKRFQNGFPGQNVGSGPVQVITPLPFWFSKGDLGVALPIDAINVDEVRVGITFRPITGLYYTESRATPSAVNGTIEGSALWPLPGSVFYKSDPVGGKVVPGLYPSSGLVSQIVAPDPRNTPTVPTSFELGDTYLLAEYIYLDKPEANRFRLANIEVPIPQHYRIEPVDSQGFPRVRIPVEINNPIRHFYVMAQNYNAPAYNAYFLATRGLTGPGWTRPAPWWPDCSGLNVAYVNDLVPGFSTRGSEALASIEILYEGGFVRTSTDNCALYRSLIPSYEERKSPWHNRYMYCIPFGVQAGYYPASVPLGEANLNRIMKKDLLFGFKGCNGSYERQWVYCWAETYNILRIYGGRATLLFAY